MELIVRKNLKNRHLAALKDNPVVAILGPRQCGKTTLARELRSERFLDLENPRDLAQLENAQTLLEASKGLIVIDEIQRRPELFPVLRHIIDISPPRSKRRFLILGSASQELIRQSSESLAGRIAFIPMTGFGLDEVGGNKMNSLWVRGSFPRSFLAKNDAVSLQWRQDFISTYLERDLPQLGISIPSQTLRRFLMMLSHYHGQLINYSELATSFGVSDKTVRSYIELLESTFMVRQVPKRLVKSPKLYIGDSGIFNALQNIKTFEELISQPKLGAAWEGFALSTFIHLTGLDPKQFFFWATHSGAELDLFWKEGGRNYGAEFKYADAPTMTKSLYSSIQDLKLKKVWILYPGTQSYDIQKNVSVVPLTGLLKG